MATTEKHPVIEVTGLKKQYKLGQIGGGTLTHDLQSWWARVRGKEDPNTVIGTDQRLFGQTFMALNGVDLTVCQGEALGIIGRNGAGKSTLLKLLSRITAPTEGEIKIRGRVASMLEVGTGFNNEMTGRENIYMNGAILGMTKAEIDLPLTASTTLDSLVNSESESDLIIDPMPNLYFTRDPFAVVGEGVNLNRMYSVTRNRETLYGKYVFKYHPDYKDVSLYFRRDCQFHTEGGDVLNINEKTLAVGISQRTQAAAIDVMAQNIFWNSDSKVERILAFDIPVSRAFMHLDTVFTQIDVDKFTIHPAIMGTLRVYELTAGKNPGDVNIRLIEDTLEHVLEDATGVDQVKLIPCGGGDPIAASREQWNDGSNTLCVEPGKICVYARNTVTNDVLYKEGLDLLVVPSAELSRGRGGPRCMSMPFWREDL